MTDLYKIKNISTLDVLKQAPEQYIKEKTVKIQTKLQKMTSKTAISDTKKP